MFLPVMLTNTPSSKMHSRGLLLSSDDLADQAGLPYKPIVMQLPLSCGVRQLKVKPSEQLRYQLRYFQQRDVFAQAGPRSTTKLVDN